MSDQSILSWIVGSKRFPNFKSQDLKDLKKDFGENIVTESDWELGSIGIHLIYSGVESSLRKRMKKLTPGLEPRLTSLCNLPAECFVDQTETRH